MKRVVPLEVVEDERDVPGNAPRGLRRLRKIAWLLDSSISLGGGRSVGLDPLIGLIPGLGDWVGAGISLYVVYEAARLGLPARVVATMLGNVAVEAVLGAVPVLGDLFDFVWKANTRNLRLVERHYSPANESRPVGRLLFGVLALGVLILVLLGIVSILIARWLWNLVA